MGKETVRRWLEKSGGGIRSVLDVGCGWGMYHDLFSSILDARWDCVEIFKPYIYRFKLWEKYDRIFLCDINDFVPDRVYDLVIFGDVLEHLPKEKAIEALKKARGYSRRYLISLPLDADVDAPQGTGEKDWGNPYEKHLGRWSHAEFLSFPFARELAVGKRQGNGEIGIYIGESGIVSDAPHLSPTPPYAPRCKFLRWVLYNRRELLRKAAKKVLGMGERQYTCGDHNCVHRFKWDAWVHFTFQRARNYLRAR